jgi:hypothetical protein
MQGFKASRAVQPTAWKVRFLRRLARESLQTRGPLAGPRQPRPRVNSGARGITPGGTIAQPSRTRCHGRRGDATLAAAFTRKQKSLFRLPRNECRAWETGFALPFVENRALTRRFLARPLSRRFHRGRVGPSPSDSDCPGSLGQGGEVDVLDRGGRDAFEGCRSAVTTLTAHH